VARSGIGVSRLLRVCWCRLEFWNHGPRRVNVPSIWGAIVKLLRADAVFYLNSIQPSYHHPSIYTLASRICWLACTLVSSYKLTTSVLFHHPSKQQASALAKSEIRAREVALAAEKQRLGIREDP
jgi:hypothetical protein